MIQIYGFWDKPFFQAFKKLPTMLKDITHSDLFNKTFPIIIE